VQYVAVCCSMLQYAAVCCRMLQYAASMLQVFCSMLQYAAVCSKMTRIASCVGSDLVVGQLHSVVLRFTVLQCAQRVAVCHSVLQYAAVSVLQYAAVCCRV